MTNAPPGLADKVAGVRKSVLDDLRQGHLLPGDVVSIADVTKRARAAVTATPVREALRQLVGEGALGEDEARGFRVPRLLPGAVRSLYAVQEMLALAMLDRLIDLSDAADGSVPYVIDDLPPAGSPTMDDWFALLQASARDHGLERAWRPLAMALLCYRRVEPQVIPEISALGTAMRTRFERYSVDHADHELRKYFRACQDRVDALCELAERKHRRI